MKGAALYAGLCGLVAALFLAVPGIDLAVSGLFYDSAQGFFLADWPPLRLVEGLVPWLVRLMIVGAVVAAAWLVLLGRPLWRLDRKALVFLVAATALGPGLIANTLLKDHWGRARPYQIAEFGGVQVGFHFGQAPVERFASCAKMRAHQPRPLRLGGPFDLELGRRHRPPSGQRRAG